MKYLSLSNGDKIPALGLGTWKSDKGEIYDTIRKAIEIGYRHFDCAYIYGNEDEIGDALRDAMADGDVARQDLWITSKLWNTHHRAEDVIVLLKTTLKSLKLDYLDLYLIHWPVAHKKEVVFPQKADDLMSLKDVSLEETWQGMEECKMAALAKHIGVSNFNTKKIEQVNKTASTKIEMNQVELHPLLAQQDLVDFCGQQGSLVTAYSPLGSKDRDAALKADDEPDMFTLPEITSIAESHNVTPAQILLAWAVNRGTVVIPKSTNPERLKLNLEAADIELSSDEMKSINALDRHFRYVNGKFFTFSDSEFTVEALWDE